MKPYKLFLDCDGVVADFDKRFEMLTGLHPRKFEYKYGEKSFWKVCEDDNDFFYDLELMPDALILYDAVKHLKPTFLTGASNNTWAVDQKTRWVKKHFPDSDIIVTRSKEKRLHMLQGYHNVIVDDWPKYRHLWEEHDGIWVLHTSAEDSIKQLYDLGVI